MKKSFLKLKTNSFLKRNKSLRNSTPYKEVTSVGIIFTVEDKQKHDIVKDFIKKLEHDGKKVEVICFLPDKKENYEFLFDFFTEKDLTLWGNITSDNAIKFSEKPFDYLFYLDREANPLIMHLIARSKAKCRIGKHTEANRSYLEFMIDSDEGTKGMIDTMYRYTVLLK